MTHYDLWGVVYGTNGVSVKNLTGFNTRYTPTVTFDTTTYIMTVTSTTDTFLGGIVVYQ